MIKQYKNGQLITIKGSLYRVMKWKSEGCVECAFYKECRNSVTGFVYSCEKYCWKGLLSFQQIFVKA